MVDGIELLIAQNNNMDIQGLMFYGIITGTTMEDIYNSLLKIKKPMLKDHTAHASAEEFAELLPSRRRRSIKRMLAAKEDDERKKLYKKSYLVTKKKKLLLTIKFSK